MPFDFYKTNISDVKIIQPKVFGDNRGYFMELFKDSFFKRNITPISFKQDNVSKSTKNVLRGLHYQIPPFSQAKLVSCLNGKILDIAVDIREKSKSFGKWISVELSSENHRMVFIPEGFAHGFVTLSDSALIHYKVSKEYSPQHERGIIWNDPKLNVDWGKISNPLISKKDLTLPQLKNTELL